MRSPEPQLDLPRLSREEIEATFRPCPICGEIECHVGGGVYRISHDFSKHFEGYLGVRNSVQPIRLEGAE
jgi:hypothetical protein